jgi:hypothetical protein
MRIIFALFLVIPLLLGSQGADAADCKYRAPFYGNTVVLGKKEQERLLAAPERWTPWKSFRTWGNQAENHGWTNGIVDGDKKYLGLKLNLVEIREGASITEGAPLWLLMADDSVIELVADAEFADKPESTQIFARYELNEETHAALVAQGLTDIRVTTSVGEIDFVLGKKKKPSDKIQESLGCI